MVNNIELVRQTDPEIAEVLEKELTRQRQHIELIASENFVSEAVLAAMGSHLTNKYAEGYPGKRYYGDEVTDKEEAKQFTKIMKEVTAHGGAANPGDFLPILNWIGNDSFETRVRRLAKRTDAFLQGLINEHRTRKESRNTLIDHLLSLQDSQPDYYTDQIIKGLILVSSI